MKGNNGVKTLAISDVLYGVYEDTREVKEVKILNVERDDGGLILEYAIKDRKTSNSFIYRDDEEDLEDICRGRYTEAFPPYTRFYENKEDAEKALYSMIEGDMGDIEDDMLSNLEALGKMKRAIGKHGYKALENKIEKIIQDSITSLEKL